MVERGLGVCEGMLIEEVRAKYPDHKYPGMESLEELCSRAEKVVTRCEESYQDENILLVTHGGTIRALLTVLTHGNIPYSGKTAWLENGCMCLMEKQENGWEMLIKD